MMKKLMMAAAFAIAAPLAAFAAPVQICGPNAAAGPYDVATGDTFLCELVFTGANATNGSVILDFESSAVPLTAAAATANLGQLGSTFDTATLEWFDKPSDVSLGKVNLNDIGLGFAGGLTTKFNGPATPDQQYVVLSWTGFKSSDNILQVSVNVAAVPVPAAGLMLLTAVGGLAVARRRKQKAA